MSQRDSFGAKLKVEIKIFTTYILKFIKDNRYYYGSCENIDKRLTMHNEGKVRSTKSRRPFILIHIEEFETRSEAQKREYYFKSIDGYI